jgi:hypothetical protein
MLLVGRKRQSGVHLTFEKEKRRLCERSDRWECFIAIIMLSIVILIY